MAFSAHYLKFESLKVKDWKVERRDDPNAENGRAARETGGRVSPRAAPTPAYGVVNVTSSVAVPPAVVTFTLPLAGPSVRTVPSAATSLPPAYVTGTV